MTLRRVSTCWSALRNGIKNGADRNASHTAGRNADTFLPRVVGRTSSSKERLASSRRRRKPERPREEQYEIRVERSRRYGRAFLSVRASHLPSPSKSLPRSSARKAPAELQPTPRNCPDSPFLAFPRPQAEKTAAHRLHKSRVPVLRSLCRNGERLVEERTSKLPVPERFTARNVMSRTRRRPRVPAPGARVSLS